MWTGTWNQSNCLVFFFSITILFLITFNFLRKGYCPKNLKTKWWPICFLFEYHHEFINFFFNKSWSFVWMFRFSSLISLRASSGGFMCPFHITTLIFDKCFVSWKFFWTHLIYSHDAWDQESAAYLRTPGSLVVNYI